MTQLSPAVAARIRRQMEAEGKRRLALIVEATALEAERFVKEKAVSGGSHPPGTPSPARPGVTCPALVTGNLRRSVISRVDRSGGTPRAQVGLATTGFYGQYLEDRGYRFISLAPDQIRNVIVPRLQRQVAAIPWPRYT